MHDGKRYLIVNADDFGLSEGTNLGIMEAHQRGIVTSASLMVRWPAAAGAAAYTSLYPTLSTGIHLDLGEWTYSGGKWVPLYEVVPSDDAGAISAEVSRQLQVFKELVGGDPTHIDSHQHIHRSEPVRSVVIEAARQIGVEVRHFSSSVSYLGSFYGQTGEGASLPDNISVDMLISMLENLEPGITELGCHPGLDNELNSVYRLERGIEVSTLCDPRVREAITELNIELCSFHEVTTRVVSSAK